MNKHYRLHASTDNETIETFEVIQKLHNQKKRIDLNDQDHFLTTVIDTTQSPEIIAYDFSIDTIKSESNESRLIEYAHKIHAVFGFKTIYLSKKDINDEKTFTKTIRISFKNKDQKPAEITLGQWIDEPVTPVN